MEIKICFLIKRITTFDKYLLNRYVFGLTFIFHVRRKKNILVLKMFLVLTWKSRLYCVN